MNNLYQYLYKTINFWQDKLLATATHLFRCSKKSIKTKPKINFRTRIGTKNNKQSKVT